MTTTDPNPVELGEKYRDKITGFEGVATARSEFLFGCVRVQLEGRAEDGTAKDYWYDEQRLVRAEDGAVPAGTATSGGDRRDAPRVGR